MNDKDMADWRAGLNYVYSVLAKKIKEANQNKPSCETVDGVPIILDKGGRMIIVAQKDWDGAEPEPAAQFQGEPVAYRVVFNVRDGVIRGVERAYVELPAPGNALKAFANDMITAAFEGGSFDGGGIQDIAVKHGLLRIEQREEECGEVCACRSEGDGFPAQCYRKTALLRGEQPASVAVVLPERMNHSDGLHTYEYVTGHNAAIDKMLGKV